MSEFLIIHYQANTESDLYFWALGGDQHPSITLGHGSLDELAPISRGKKVSVLLSANQTALKSISVPSKNRSKQIQAVPFAMEDYLGEDIDGTHFAIGKSSENTVPVISIKRSLLQASLEFFKQHEIHVDLMTADCIALPIVNNQWTILVNEQTALIKIDHDQAHNCDRQNLAQILQALLSQLEKQPERIQLIHKADDTEIDSLLGDLSIEVEKLTYQNHALEIFVQNLNDIHNFNLLQGDFTVKREVNMQLQPWKSVASIATLWLVLQLGYSGVMAKQLEEKNYLLNRQIETEFKRAMPDARKMTNMRKRVERQLKELTSSGGDSNKGSFLNILSKVSTVLSNNEKITIRSATYKKNHVDLTITSKTLNDIEQIKSRLDAISSIKSTLSTTVEKNQVEARLRIQVK